MKSEWLKIKIAVLAAAAAVLMLTAGILAVRFPHKLEEFNDARAVVAAQVNPANTATILPKKSFAVVASLKSEDKDSYGHTRYDAMVIAEKEIKEILKSPSTAKFCSTSDATITRSGNTWEVEGWVDAQNGYGAMLRKNFTVKFKFVKKDTYSVSTCSVY